MSYISYILVASLSFTLIRYFWSLQSALKNWANRSYNVSENLSLGPQVGTVLLASELSEKPRMAVSGCSSPFSILTTQNLEEQNPAELNCGGPVPLRRVLSSIVNTHGFLLPDSRLCFDSGFQACDSDHWTEKHTWNAKFLREGSFQSNALQGTSGNWWLLWLGVDESAWKAGEHLQIVFQLDYVRVLPSCTLPISTHSTARFGDSCSSRPRWPNGSHPWTLRIFG